MPVITPPTTRAEESERFAQSFAFEGVGQPQGDGQPGEAPTPPSIDLPRIDTDQYSAPERPTGKRQALALMQALGAAGAVAGASGDDALMTRVGAGLSSAGRKGVQQIDEEFAAKQKAFQDFMRESRRFNLQQQTKEEQARFDTEMARYESELDQPTAAEEALTDEEAETERARQEKYREQGDAAIMRAKKYGSGSNRRDEELPDNPDDLRSLKRQLDAEIKAVRNQIPTDTNMMGEPRRPVLSRQLSERVANLTGQRARIQEKLRQMEGTQQGDPSTQEVREFSQGAGQAMDDMYNDAARSLNNGGAVAPGRRGTQEGSGGGQGGQGQFQLPAQVEERIRENAPPDVPVDSLRKAASMVMSDTTQYEPADFQRAFGFNPFQ